MCKVYKLPWASGKFVFSSTSESINILAFSKTTH